MGEALTAREVSSFFWFAVFCCWMIWKDKDGKLNAAFKNLFRCALSPWIVTIFSLTIFWVIGVVVVLSKLGLWRIENLKLTFYWAIGVAIVSLFESKAARKKFTGFSMVRDHLGAIAVIQIFVSIRPLPLAAEFVLVPVSSVLIMVMAFSENKTEYKHAKKASESGLVFIGLVLLSWSLLALYNSPKYYFGDLLTNIFLPSILTVGFLPFLIFFFLFLGYEHSFRAITGREGLGRLDKLKISLLAFKCAGFNLEHISLLEKHIRIHRPNSRSDMIEVIENLSYTFNIPSGTVPNLSPKLDSMGWVVPNSQRWLSQYNLVPKFYEWLGHTWQAHDSVESSIQNSKTILTYYISGSRHRATELELVLQGFGDHADNYLLNQFSDAAVKLVKIASGEPLANVIRARIKKRDSFLIDQGQCTIQFSYNEFRSPPGIEVKLLIRAGTRIVENETGGAW